MCLRDNFGPRRLSKEWKKNSFSLCKYFALIANNVFRFSRITGSRNVDVLKCSTFTLQILGCYSTLTPQGGDIFQKSTFEKEVQPFLSDDRPSSLVSDVMVSHGCRTANLITFVGRWAHQIGADKVTCYRVTRNVEMVRLQSEWKK